MANDEVATISEDGLVELSKLNAVSDADLRNIDSFDSALAYVEQEHGGVVDVSEEIGNGFTLLSSKDKARLVGQPTLLVGWKILEGDYGKYVFVAAVTKDGGRYMFVDGSTGVRDQLVDYSARTKRFGGLLLNHGLRASEYDVEVDGKTTKATTFYLDTSGL